MLKRNKKIWHLFFVISILTQFSFTKPMLSKLRACFCCRERRFDPCRPPTGTKITALPGDCLYTIFQFFVSYGTTDEAFKLVESVGEFFRKALDNRPCFLADDLKDSKGDPIFLFWPLSRGSMECRIKFYQMDLDEKNFINFLRSDNLKKLVQNPINLYISLVTRVGSLENKIFFRGKKNRLKINYFSEFTGAVLEYLTGLQELEVTHCDNFTGVGLKNLKNLKKLKVKDRKNFDEKEIEYLKDLQCLVIKSCSEFTGASIRNLTNLQCLKVVGRNKFDETVLENQKKLTELVVGSCDNFTGVGLKKLNLHSLQVVCCPKFHLNVLKVLKSLQRVEIVLNSSDYKEFEMAEGTEWSFINTSPLTSLLAISGKRVKK